MEKNQSPVIIVVAYNRADSLKRLLQSVAMASYGDTFPDLVISIDYSESHQADINDIADKFEWQGHKKIISHPKNLGLKSHIFYCGDLTKMYDAVIVLEDDLFVSKGFYEYAQRALQACHDQTDVAGIALYNNTYNEAAALPFEAIEGSGDFYLMQVPCSWGQIWTKAQWESFKDWYDTAFNDQRVTELPEGIRDWSEHSWKKPYFLYLIQTQQYFAYPYVSYSMNLNEPGTNIKVKDFKFLNSLKLSNEDRPLILDRYPLRYDAAFMLKPEIITLHNAHLGNHKYQIDFFGSKLHNLSEDDWLLTTLEVDTYEKSFGLELKPIELNIIYGIEGKEIFLTKKKNIKSTQMKKQIINYYYPIPHWYLKFFQEPVLKRITDSIRYQIKSVFKN